MHPIIVDRIDAMRSRRPHPHAQLSAGSDGLRADSRENGADLLPMIRWVDL
jgi:hypothetical protein